MNMRFRWRRTRGGASGHIVHACGCVGVTPCRGYTRCVRLRVYPPVGVTRAAVAHAVRYFTSHLHLLPIAVFILRRPFGHRGWR
jgi:hypothetical protein